ncbi:MULTISPECIES: EAL domain-containing protein [unclassified Planococcus (in: firmicutes)]|uniref:EAL domain-containing protein n=1 Tax=Planococcus TaxID=1372 RepID=UPI000C334393|nr:MULTISPECIES: EAL domain-containing protein [unclassified Planococcus (in: firmicutes)]AUD13277.1 diguanylate cyclase [Planococcus sp. MB-3u-03]PKG45953.1 diguanylate cyclase [Planococcus sp. Urea-trap-24]PKG89174.1 diguanylate cyclase [Planococcus sp. Urea-3u-39]PKH41653.1 diguanylate cyclase [Planococcus sp. MB-3u-09]
MDPLDIIDNMDKIMPVFQPIVSAVKHDVIGYELLGRYIEPDGTKSLGDFFNDPEVPDEFKTEVDQRLLEMALDQLLLQNNGCLLFINRNARQLMAGDGEDFLKTLLEYRKRGFPLERIVLEITEHDFNDDFDTLNHLLLYFKTYGIQIAVDHVGAKSSNIDRIRQLRPHILKIDMSISRHHQPDAFQDIIHSLSMLAHRIGARLLYEYIEDNHQLYFAWKHGGHYYQGYYLAHPDPELLTTDSLSIHVGDQVKEFVHREKAMVSERLAYTARSEEKLKRLMGKWQSPDYADLFIQEVLPLFEAESFRIYICNSDGEQVSSNFRKTAGSWHGEAQQIGSHWAFRPYFLENMMLMKASHKGRLSDIYADIETGEMIRTFSYPLSDECFLFIDLSYEFISENDYLLFQ